jgi:hypothetical protein
MSRWISLYWLWLLPALTVLATLIRFRYLRLAHRRGLIALSGRRWTVLALAGAQALIWFTQLSLIYPTNILLPLVGLAALGLTVIALRNARPHLHSGLHGLQRPLPRDGLELIERGERRRRTLPRWLALLPALGLLIYIAAHHPAQWLGFSLLALTFIAPLILIPYRRYWLLPLLLLPSSLVVLMQALALRDVLPHGNWAAPITGAQCQGQLRVSAPRAWCVNPFTGTVYQFDLPTGLVTFRTEIPESARIFAANADQSWIQQNPAQGLMRVEAASGAATTVRALSAHSGAADSQGRLWVIDVGDELTVYDGESATPLRAREGLLNNTAFAVKVSPGGDVWVTSIEGVSWLPEFEIEWRTLNLRTELSGAVRNLAFAPDGSVWLLWQARNARSWGVVVVTRNGLLANRVDLGALTGLPFPAPEDALAVDGLGRAWFVSQSVSPREKYLGLLTFETGQPLTSLYSLGAFAASGPFVYGGPLWENSFGVVADGEGGILLFNGEAGWRHWKP